MDTIAAFQIQSAGHPVPVTLNTPVAEVRTRIARGLAGALPFQTGTLVAALVEQGKQPPVVDWRVGVVVERRGSVAA